MLPAGCRRVLTASVRLRSRAWGAEVQADRCRLTLAALPSTYVGLVTVRSRQSALADARARGSFQGNTQVGHARAPRLRKEGGQARERKER